MKKRFLYISIHHQETVDHPAYGESQRDLQSLADELFSSIRSDEQSSGSLPPELCLQIIQDSLEQNDYDSEKAVIFDDGESRTMLLAMTLDAEHDMPVPDSGLWYRTTDEREGLAYFAQMVLMPYNPFLERSIERFQEGLESVKKALSPNRNP
jgi:hypothetical protein